MGSFFKICGMLIFWIAGIVGFILCLGVVANNLGFIGTVIAFMLFPVTILVAPWYEALANSNWFLVLLIYGGGIVSAIFGAIGSALDD
jgi:hypothetical protein